LPLIKLSGSALEQKILSTERANLIAYWPLKETSGVTADNAEGTAARDGSYSGPTLGQSQSPFVCPSFDGINDYVNIYSASFASAFSGAAGTVVTFGKVSGAGIWTDDTYHALLYIRVNDGNRLRLVKGGGGELNRLLAYYTAGTVNNFIDHAVTPTDWFMWACTWDAVADEFIAYYNGSEVATLNTLGTWAGSLDSTKTVIGAFDTTPQFTWSGWLAHTAIWTKALTAAQILNLYQVSGI
jgi:hypothetical protein